MPGIKNRIPYYNRIPYSRGPTYCISIQTKAQARPPRTKTTVCGPSTRLSVYVDNGRKFGLRPSIPCKINIARYILLIAGGSATFKSILDSGTWLEIFEDVWYLRGFERKKEGTKYFWRTLSSAKDFGLRFFKDLTDFCFYHFNILDFRAARTFLTSVLTGRNTCQKLL